MTLRGTTFIPASRRLLLIFISSLFLIFLYLYLFFPLFYFYLRVSVTFRRGEERRILGECPSQPLEEPLGRPVALTHEGQGHQALCEELLGDLLHQEGRQASAPMLLQGL